MDGCAYFASLVISRNIDQSIVFLSPKLHLHFFYGKIIFTQYDIQFTQRTEAVMLQNRADDTCDLLLDVSLTHIHLGRFYFLLIADL